MSLKKYADKRNLKESSEPSAKKDDQNGQRFVVQRHDASTLHFDLRLEINGALKSWAVPKGPSMRPKTKRLAIQTEDHPVGYLTFEGRIPKGNYGAGTVYIWDQGTFEAAHSKKKPPSLHQQWKGGELKIIFKGKKLKGEFVLVKTSGGKKDNQWLLIKKKDKYSTDAPYDAEEHAETHKIPKIKELRDSDENSFVKPMLASPKKKIFDDRDWVFERKWDGYRMLSSIKNGEVKCYSRNGKSFTKKFRKIAKALEEIPHEALLDGEVVALDKKGLPDFQALQNYPQNKKGDLRYYVFDLLFLNGHSTVNLKLTDRKSLIPKIIEDCEGVYYCDHVQESGKKFYKETTEVGIEGVMAKKADAPYTPDHRSENWLKIKAENSQEALICGYTESETETAFGSLILGVYQNKALTYIGNCGTGFSEDQKDKLLKKFKPLTRKTCPFSETPNLKGRVPHWLTPKLIAEVNFSEWTDTGKLRHPVFKSLRQDKAAEQIRKQVPLEEQNPQRLKQSGDGRLEIDGISVSFTHLKKVLWPKSGLRKYDLIDYYLQIAGTVLPYLKDRPQNLHRHPDGIESQGFYQKNITKDLYKKWMETASIYSKSNDENIDYLLCQNEAALLYMANLGCIELNPWNSQITQLDQPDYTVIDLDPSKKNSFEEVIETAQAAKTVLEDLKIPGYCKTSGSAGLHIFLPLHAQYTYNEARDFTELLCRQIHKRLPKLTTLERQKDKRQGRVYLDYMQNAKGQSLAAPYCVRPRENAPVSAPLAWKEVKKGLKITDFNLKNMPDRLKDKGDLFEGVLGKGFDMETVLDRLKD